MKVEVLLTTLAAVNALSPQRRTPLTRRDIFGSGKKNDGGANPLKERLKKLLDDEDFAGAAEESAAVLDLLPDLADVARMRGRALLDPLLDEMIEGAVFDKTEFEEA